MSQGTPGRRARQDKYVPFNNDPKGVGTRTNTVMPKDVPLTLDGFEDPEAFFRSPGSVIDPNRSMMSVMSKAPRTPGGRSAVMADTPMTGYTERTHLTSATPAGTSGPSRRGRMSDMIDDEDGLAADELLVDDDELALDAPGAYFTDNNPPAVTLPSRSRLPPDSPSMNMDYDNVPSPRKSGRSPRKSTIGVNYRPPGATTPASRLRSSNANTDADVGLISPRGPEDASPDELDEALASPAATTSPDKSLALSPTQTSPQTQNRKRKSPTRSPKRAGQKSKSQHENAEVDDAESGDETERPRKDRYSMASRRSNGTRNGDRLGEEDDGSQSDNDNAPSFHYDGDGDGGADDLGGFNQGDTSGFANDFANGGGDDDVDMEQAAVRAEEEGASESEEEQEPVEDIIRKRKAKPKAAPAKKKATTPRAASAPRTAREGSVASKPKKTRISQIGMGSEDEDEDGIHGNFTTRRSQRQHFKPLEWWRNEHFEYARGPKLPVIKEVVTYPEEKISFAELKKTRARARRTNKREGRGRSESQALSPVVEEAVEVGWDAKTDPTGIVMDFAKGQEVHRKVACPQALLEPKMVKGGTFKYQKVFGEGAFMAAGVVYIPVGLAKGAKPSKDNCYVFYLIQGAVQVTVHRTSFVMAPGAQFLVPRGNEYSIENISEDKEAQLFFAQARKIRRDEADNEVGLED